MGEPANAICFARYKRFFNLIQRKRGGKCGEVWERGTGDSYQIGVRDGDAEELYDNDVD